jgi:two-component system, cell cycle response regulator DivK
VLPRDFPVRRAAPAPRGGSRSARDGSPYPERGDERRTLHSPARVLFVDDAPDMRTMYGRYFQFRGLDVVTASDGIEALQSVDSQRPDVLVVDLAMPRVTGWDVIRELRANPSTRDLPIIALSGHDACRSALDAGADVYRDKPCTPQELLHEVLLFMRGSHPSRGH